MIVYSVELGETIVDVCINSLGDASVENIFTVLEYNDLNTLTPNLYFGQILNIPDDLVTTNSNALNVIKEVYKVYPIVDYGILDQEEIDVLLFDFDELLSTVPVPVL